MKKTLVSLTLVFSLGIISIPAHGNEPLLVVDKCPEFCPPKPNEEKNLRICTQVLIPVLGKPGFWYTDSCKTKIVKARNKGRW